MGYSIHIERHEERWDADSGGGIPLEEWKAFVDRDENMQFDNVADITTPDGDVFRYESEGRVVWYDKSGHGEADRKVWFDFHHGRIFANNPSPKTIQKMRQIASHFDARVMGEDGEEYVAEDEIPVTGRRSSSAKKPWWKFW
ncbi:MAG: hypothetical protein JXM70_11485 [Pirellulales bacterium]|nr:hypothetical protein [Pirellulales bacterium]